MAFRSIAVNETPSSSLVVTKPAGVVSGDVLVAFALNDGNAANFSWPSGFTAVTGTPINTTFDGQQLGAAIKIAGGSEPANYTITASTTIIGGIAAFSGGADPQPHRSSATSNDNGNASPWSITSAAFSSNTSVTSDMVIVAGSDTTTSGNVAHSGPTGYTVQADIRSGFINAMLSTKDSVASGESGVQTATGTLAGASSAWAVFAIALELSAGAFDPATMPVMTGFIATGRMIGRQDM